MEYVYFPVTLGQLDATIRYHELTEGVFDLGAVKVTARYMNHPGLALGYRLEAGGAAVVYATDHEPHSRHQPELADPAQLLLVHREDQRQNLREALRSGARVFLFTAQKLGGEVDLPETDASPGAAVDMSVMEVTALDSSGKPATYGKHLFYEIQTADFHGSPLHAAKHLRDLCAAGEPGDDYHASLLDRVEVCGTGVEGPNKANIFKRTIYQMIFKIELAARHADCAGFAIVLPVPVWDSWVRHLGQPTFQPIGDDATNVRLPQPEGADLGSEPVANIYVFDIDTASKEVPNPLRIVKRVSCSAAALAHYAFVVAAEKAMAKQVVARFRSTFMQRAEKGWRNQLRRGEERTETPTSGE
jgi:hypothetical protein